MKRLGEILLEKGYAGVGELHTALEACHRHRTTLGYQLLQLGYVTEAQLLEALSEQTGRAQATRELLQRVTPEVRKVLPIEIARRLKAVPFARVHRQLQVAFANPRDVAAIEEVQFFTGSVVEPFVATEAAIQAVLDEITRAASKRARDSESPTSSELNRRWDSLWHGHHPDPTLLLDLPPDPAEEVVGKPLYATFPALSTVSDPTEIAGTGSIDEMGLCRALCAAESKEAVGEALLSYASQFLTRLCLFSVYRERIHGWLVSGLGPVLEDVQTFSVKADQPSLLKTVSGMGSYHQGPVPPGEVDQMIASCLGEPLPQDVIILPIRVKDKSVGFLLGDIPGQSTVGVPLRDLEAATKVTGVAFELIILRRKIELALAR